MAWPAVLLGCAMPAKKKETILDIDYLRNKGKKW